MKQQAFKLIVVFLVFLSGIARSEDAPQKTSDWYFGASIYGWLPDIAGQTAFTPPGGSGDFEVGVENILENLKFTMMGTLEARKGRWGVFTDLIYMDVGGSQTGKRNLTIGGQELPVDVVADVGLDLKSLIWTAAGSFRMVDKSAFTMDVLAGARYLDIEQKLNWTLTGNIGSIPIPDRSGNAAVTASNLDAIVGLRGRFAFGAKKSLYVPYALDVGAGDSDLTWQGVVGVGYSFGWWELAAVYRYLYYDLGPNSAINDISFGGPGVGVLFKW